MKVHGTYWRHWVKKFIHYIFIYHPRQNNMTTRKHIEDFDMFCTSWYGG